MNIPFVDLAAQRRRLGDRLDEAIARVLDHGRYILGPEVAELETALAERVGVRHVIGCSSGTDALVLALRALDVGADDAVFVPSFTFAATAEAVVLAGATPVLVDSSPETFNIDVRSLDAAVDQVTTSTSLRPRAVIPVDLFGQPADYDRVGRVADARGLAVVADAAQSFGAAWRDRPVGKLAAVTTTSFFPAKPLGCYGDGGAVFTDDDDVAEAVRSLRVHGQGADKYDNVRVGMNARLDTIQAAILLVKLTIFDDEVKARNTVADRYSSGLADVVMVPDVASEASSVWAQYTIRVPDRDDVAAKLSDEGIPTATYYARPLHRQYVYGACPSAPGELGVSDALADEVLSLPMHPYLDPETQDRIISAIRSATEGQ